MSHSFSSARTDTQNVNDTRFSWCHTSWGVPCKWTFEFRWYLMFCRLEFLPLPSQAQTHTHTKQSRSICALHTTSLDFMGNDFVLKLSIVGGFSDLNNSNEKCLHFACLEREKESSCLFVRFFIRLRFRCCSCCCFFGYCTRAMYK